MRERRKSTWRDTHRDIQTERDTHTEDTPSSRKIHTLLRAKHTHTHTHTHTLRETKVNKDSEAHIQTLR